MLFLTDYQALTIILLLVCIVPLLALIIISFVKGIIRQKKAQAKKGEAASSAPDFSQKAIFEEAYGGEDNITSIEQKVSRLTVKVKDLTLVNAEKLKELGATGVLFTEDMVKVSFGDRAPYIYRLMTATEEKKDEGEEARHE